MQKKSDRYKKPLLHKRVLPVSAVVIENDETAFQGYRMRTVREASFPLLLESESVILDFGDHYTGYLHMRMSGGTDNHIPDSPTNIAFNFAEMPIELAEKVEGSPRSLSVGWLQNDFKTIVFMPYEGSLERRYSFRYLKIQRVDSVRFPVKIEELYLDSVSAVEISAAKPADISDELLQRIDKVCLKTLKECEQDVFEDGPKRDRRLWIGDLRLQALVDYESFRNIPLIKRCILLFAENTNSLGLIAPCVFPDTPPFIDQWVYLDYSLCLISCLSDYFENTGDAAFVEEIYPIALRQIEYAASVFDRESGSIQAPFFIDHGKFDKTVASLGLMAYTLRQMRTLAAEIQKDAGLWDGLLHELDDALLRYYSPEDGLFVSPGGEISWHSQVWAALSGALGRDAVQKLLKQTAAADPPVRLSSPFMMHYYLESLYACGLVNTAECCIKEYWGSILDAGFDCCPECFQPGNDRFSPYGYPAMNSACHAWSCSASYWIRKFHMQSSGTGTSHHRKQRVTVCLPTP